MTPRSDAIRAGDPASGPTVSVVICTYTARRWPELQRAVTSTLRQSRPPDEVVVVVDHDEPLLRRARAALDAPVTVVSSTEAPGLAGARNTGVQRSTGEVIAFLDDDACAEADWLESLVGAYADPRVLGVGGVVEPAWEGRAPAWLPAEFYWTVGCSYAGLPTRLAPVRNPIGANMSFRRRAFERAGGFRDGVGRVGTVPLGCEETEFSIRAVQAEPGAIVLHAPAARVEHVVGAQRTTWRYFAARCWAEGLSKATVSSLVGRQESLASERRYVTRTLPVGIARGVADALGGDPSGLSRASAIVAGLSLTAAGYARGCVASRASARRDRPSAPAPA